jgi:hypothetical protein
MLHCRFRAPAAWDAYRAGIRRGIRYAPIYTRNFALITAQLDGEPVPFAQHAPPTRFPLDDIHEASATQQRPHF